MTENASYSVIVKGYDWGPGNSKIIINLDSKITQIEDDTFKVVAKKEYSKFDFEEKTSEIKVGEKEIKVRTNYLSDDKGNRVTEESDKITLELEVHPGDVFTSPYNYNFESGLNEEVGIDYTITQIKPLATVNNNTIKGLKLTKENQANIIKPEMENFSKDVFEYSDTTYGEIEIPYSYYTPQNIETEHPLIILFHGAGEGGTDPEIPLYGNKGVALASDEIQSYFEEAYILAPQAKTMWMDDGTGQYTKDGKSKYTEAALSLIETFIKENNVNQSKVYIGGGSNGGYMTINLLLAKPELFAAGFPICEAYSSDWISDEELQNLEGMPLWFIHSEIDPVVLFDKTAEPLVKRLKEVSSGDIQLTVYKEILDQTGLYKDEEGNPYHYNDHWSWIHLFNDEVEKDGKSIFEWLNSQSK